MGFAQPLALAFFALFIPIILLYLLKQRRRRVQVSTLLFWDQILRDEHRVTSLTRLRKLLSLLLQLLFVTLLTLALARPVLSKNVLGARRIVVLLDTSASMTAMEAGGTRFARAKALARDVIRGMSPGDTLMLAAVSNGADVVAPFTNSRRELLDALDAVEAGHAETDFGGAMDLLKRLPSDERETHVYVITDGAFEPVPFEGPPERLRFAYLRVGEARDNVGITAFELRPLPASPRDFELLFEAVNETDQERRVPYEVRVDGSLIDAGEIVLAARGRATRSISQFTRTGGEAELFLDVDDAFPLDNRAYAVLPTFRPVEVTLVTEGNLFLENALLTDDGVRLRTLTPVLYEGTPAEAPEMQAGAVKLFDRWAPAAGPAGDCIFIGAWPAEVAPSSEGTLERPLITQWDREHPVNRHLQWTNITIESAKKLPNILGFEPIVRSFDDPLVLFEEGPGRQTMVVAFDTASTDLPLRIAFPLLIANTVRYMAQSDEGGPWESARIGSHLTAADVDRYGSRAAGERVKWTRVLRPGEPAAPEGGMAGGLIAVDRAGVYRLVTEDGKLVPAFAANLSSRRESRIAPSETLPIASDAPLPEITEGFRLGLAPWFVLTLAALGLIVTEWVLFHRRVVE